MVATLSKVGSTFQLSNQRSYDAWGAIRLGATAGDPKDRYCANLGHKQDDESGLVYMRARYYEPTSGRFISQDPSVGGKTGSFTLRIIQSTHLTELATRRVVGLLVRRRKRF